MRGSENQTGVLNRESKQINEMKTKRFWWSMGVVCRNFGSSLDVSLSRVLGQKGMRRIDVDSAMLAAKCPLNPLLSR